MVCCTNGAVVPLPLSNEFCLCSMLLFFIFFLFYLLFAWKVKVKCYAIFGPLGHPRAEKAVRECHSATKQVLFPVSIL